MDQFELSIQHIQTDLEAIVALTNRKNKESIFVDIYSKDRIVLSESESFVTKALKKVNASKIISFDTVESLKQHMNEEAELNASDHGKEPITNYVVFDKLSQEILLIHRYPFILGWYKKLKLFVLNPVTLILLSKLRVFVNLLLLTITIMAVKTLPDNSIVQYFLGENSPVIHMLWIPYVILLLFDVNYLSKLYLLISEMSSRQAKDKRSKSFILSASLNMNETELSCVMNYARKYKISIFRFINLNDEQMGYASDDLVRPDISFIVPDMPEQKSQVFMKMFGSYRSLSNADQGENQDNELEEILGYIHPDSLSQPERARRIVMNYQFITEQNQLSKAEQVLLIKLLDIQCQNTKVKTIDALIKAAMSQEESNKENIKSLIQKIKPYLL